MSCKLKKNTRGPSSPLYLLYFKDCVMITNVWFCYFLSVIYLDSWGYMGWGPVRVLWKISFSVFFFPFFSILFFFFFFLDLSFGAPLAPGPLDIVHPCHPVATQLILGGSIETQSPLPWLRACFSHWHCWLFTWFFFLFSSFLLAQLFIFKIIFCKI